MTRLLGVALLVSHGLIHAAIYAVTQPAAAEPAPFEAAHSWVFGDSARTHTAAAQLAWATGGLFTVAAALLALDLPAWAPVAAAGALVGLLLKVLWFNPWLTAGVLIDIAVVWVAALR